MPLLGTDRHGREVRIDFDEDFRVRYSLADGSMSLTFDLPGLPRADVMARFDAHWPEGVTPDPALPSEPRDPPDVEALIAGLRGWLAEHPEADARGIMEAAIPR